jgi:quercetin dioxygenase-like cupin family protein
LLFIGSEIPDNDEMKPVSDLNASSLHMDWTRIPVETPEPGVERQMVVGQNVMICRLRFIPHLKTTPHRHPHEQMTLVVQGRARFIIGDEERVAQAGDVLHFPPNCWHGATMLDEEVTLIDIFSPIREDFLKAREPVQAGD